MTVRKKVICDDTVRQALQLIVRRHSPVIWIVLGVAGLIAIAMLSR